MISVEDAQERVLAEIAAVGTEQLTFTDVLGRVLREDIIATSDVPQADNTAMDGYAVRADDIANPPVRLRVIEDLPAGTVATKNVESGTAIRIMTGALIPDGADTVAHVEITDAGSDFVTINHTLKRGTNLRGRGEDMRAGDVVLAAGTFIGAAEVGVLASVQKSVVRVARRPCSGGETVIPGLYLCRP